MGPGSARETQHVTRHPAHRIHACSLDIHKHAWRLWLTLFFSSMTHFLMSGRFYNQRNSSTPLLSEPACRSLALWFPNVCPAKYHHFHMLWGLFSLLFVLPDAFCHRFYGTTVQDIQAIAELIVFPVQNPPRIRETPDMHCPVTQSLQLLRDMVHVHQDAYAARTDDRTEVRFHTNAVYSVNVYRADLLPVRSRTSALSKPLPSNSFTTSLMIRAPRNP